MANSVVRYWRLSLAAGLATLGVVVLLLETVARTAEQIETSAAQIWQVGKLIAGHTVQMPILGRVNQNVVEVSRAADGIAEATERCRLAAIASSTKEG